MIYKSSFWLLIIFLISTCIIQANPKETETKPVEITAYAPYCGIECLYVVLKNAEPETDIRNLLKPEFISSKEGSSLLDLKKAATSFGMSAEVVTNFSCSDIKALSMPIILHVKSKPESLKYDHYWLYTGNGKARIFDPPNRIETIPYYKLASRWDGMGLIVSTEPIELAEILAPARKRFAIFAGAVIAAIVLVKVAGGYLTRKVGSVGKSLRLGFSIVQTGGLVAVALFVGVIYHFANDEGFLAHAGATEPIVKASIGSFIPKVSSRDVEKAYGSAVIIDARRAVDYKAGHIKGAINIPMTLCAAGRSAKLAEVAKDSRLVIYCQSAGCPYAERVAVNLMEDGFTNLAIYKGGWVDWEKRKGSRDNDENNDQQNENDGCLFLSDSGRDRVHVHIQCAAEDSPPV